MKIAMIIGLLAIALVGLGMPSAFALDGPTPPEVADPVQAGTYPEIQVIDLGGPTAGSFIMYADATCSWTGAIVYDATAVAVEGAIDATLGGCLGGGGNAAVTGADGGPWTVTVTGTSPLNLPPFVLNGAGLTGGAPVVHAIQDGTTIGSADVAPHGGYSSMTDYCLQCHQVHTNSRSGDYVGEYALLADLSVTSTCATCHGYLGASPTGAEDPGFPGVEGTASLRAVYTAEPVHTIGATSSRYEGNWSYGWGFGGPSGPSTRRAGAGTASTYGGGFNCGTCHTPHGEFGQLINSKWVYTTADQAGGASAVPAAVVNWQNNTRIWWNDPSTPAHSFEQRYLFYNSAPPGTEGWMVCTGLNGAGPCSYAQTHDAEGQLVSLYGYKLLAYVPNHQYPVKSGGLYTYGSAGGTLPPGGMYAPPSFQGGVLVLNAGNPTASGGTPPNPVLNTESVLGALDATITAADTTVLVTSSSSTLGGLVAPFKMRIDEEIMMVTAKAPVAGGTGTAFTLTVVRSGENAEQPWLTNAAAAHTAGAEVLRIPTILVDETGFGLTPPGATSAVALPFHITFGTGTPTNTEVAVVQGRTAAPTSGAGHYLYTVGRAVDGTAQNENHLAGASILVQAGTSVATVKSWGTDIYDHDQALWCGTCHTGSVDSMFGGQWHSHPTGCLACHGNPADGSSADFPHSSTNSFMLQEVPDALCLTCHTPGSLP